MKGSLRGRRKGTLKVPGQVVTMVIAVIGVFCHYSIVVVIVVTIVSDVVVVLSNSQDKW